MLVQEWEKQATKRLGPGRLWSPTGSSTRNELSSAIQYWNAVSIILRCGDGLLVAKSQWLGEGWLLAAGQGTGNALKH